MPKARARSLDTLRRSAETVSFWTGRAASQIAMAQTTAEAASATTEVHGHLERHAVREEEPPHQRREHQGEAEPEGQPDRHRGGQLAHHDPPGPLPAAAAQPGQRHLGSTLLHRRLGDQQEDGGREQPELGHQQRHDDPQLVLADPDAVDDGRHLGLDERAVMP